MTETISPRILILEGLWSDTAEVVDQAGGDAEEVYPWDLAEVEEKLLSGDYHGMILTGGSDIDPRLYHEKPHKEVYGVDQLRDTTEFYALDMASQLGIPVLGICRGSQIMCAYRGGKLTQHIEGHRGGHHPVTATPDARTFKRAANSRDMDVVSLHHQCIRRPGKGMLIAARARDKTPEAIESKDGLWLGVQFHPELNATQNANSFAIFQWLVRAAAKYAGGQAPRTKFSEVKRTTFRTVAATAVAVTTNKKKPAKNRQAGTRTYREGTRSGETVTGWSSEFDGINAEEQELTVCPDCGLIFDYKIDRDDHVRYVHKHEPFAGAVSRYPELMPPAGHEAWDEDAEWAAVTDDYYNAVMGLGDGS